MPKERTYARLTQRDIELIVAVVVRAHRDGCTVAEVVERRLQQNETALSMWRPPKQSARARGRSAKEPDPEYGLITAETRRLLRLRRRFASWQSARPADGEAT